MSQNSFILQSEGVADGILADKYGINNLKSLVEGVPTLSLPLSWKNPPPGTVSLSLVFEDYDNIEDEGVVWIHWLVSDIPADINNLYEDESRTNPKLIQGRNSWYLPYGPYEGTSQDVICHYGGPAPSRPHEYECSLFALDCFLDLKNGFFLNQLRKAMEGHILATTTLTMQYNPN